MWYLDLLGGLVTNPKTTLKVYLVERRGIYPVFLTLMLSSISLSAILTAPMVKLILYFAPIEMIRQMIIPAMIMAGIVGSIVSWLILAAIVHFIATAAFGGGGSFAETLEVIGLSIYISLLPSVVLGLATLFLNPITSLIAIGLGGVAGFIWFMVVASIGVSQAHGISFGRSLASLIITFLILALIAVTPAILLAWW